MLSFLCLHETEIEESKVTFNLIVQYDKDHIPFPENDNENMEARIEQLERNNEQLLDRLRLFRSETERYVGPMRRRLHRVLRERDEANMFISTCENVFKMNNSKYMECYRNILRDCYKTMNKSHECPICYENIEYMNVFTTPCNHIMCNWIIYILFNCRIYNLDMKILITDNVDNLLIELLENNSFKLKRAFDIERSDALNIIENFDGLIVRNRLEIDDEFCIIYYYLPIKTS